MKKQILLLIVAFMASMSFTFGQALQPGTNKARPLENCEDFPLHPRAGVPYIYDVSVTGDGAPATSYQWWATKNQNFIQTLVTGVTTTNIADSLRRAVPGELINYSNNYGQKTTTSSVEITWSPEILAGTSYQGDPAPGTPTFVVAIVESECTNNIQVYEIKPTASFTLDIANISPETLGVLPFDDLTEQCVDVVRGATYNAGVIDMNYGWDTLFFEVVAANFVTSWLPTFQIMGGLTAPQTATIGWATTLANARAGTFIEPAQAISTTAVTGTTPLTSGVTNTSEGVALYVRVVISNNTFESLANQDFILAVDGIDASDQWDIDHLAATCDATGADQADKATHTITARPTVIDATNDDEVIEPNDFIEKPE